MTSASCLPIPVFAYHRVLPHKAPIAVPVEEFEHQLQWLRRRGFRTLTGSEFGQALRGELQTDRAVVLTFDDGYFDNWYFAAPLLEKYGMSALLFVITGKIGEHKQRSVGAWNGHGDERYLSWQEIDLMVASGTFEVHTHTHTHTRFWDGERLAAETKLAVCQDVASSLQVLRSRGYIHEIQLAWPWGYFRREWLDDVAAMGIKTCYTMRPGTNFPGCDTRLIRRLGGDAIGSNEGWLFSVGTSRVMGRGLNGASRVWGGLRGRP